MRSIDMGRKPFNNLSSLARGVILFRVGIGLVSNLDPEGPAAGVDLSR